MATEPLLIRTSIGGYVFDAYLQVQHTSTLTITTNPVETGAAIADNAYLNPPQLTFQIGMTDVARDVIPGQFGSGRRGVTAFALLKELQRARLPVEVVTRLETYDNMLVQSVSAQDDNTTAHGLKATVVMQEIFVATVQSVKISARPQVTGSTNKGSVQAVKPNQSLLDMMFQAFGIPPQ